jgi:hypothetical protein
MANRKSRFILKRSNVPGKVPTLSDLITGELALNTADAKLYTESTSQGAIVEIGWDKVSKSGDTMSGQLVAPSFSANTYYGDGSNLTGIEDSYLTGGTFSSNGTLTLTLNNSKPDVNINLSGIKRLSFNSQQAFQVSTTTAYFTTSSMSFIAFDGTGNSSERCSFEFIVPTDYVSGGTFYIIYMTQATTENIKFEIDITSVNIGDSAANLTETGLYVVVPGSSSDYILQESPQISPVTTNFTPNKITSVTLIRLAGDTEDNYNGTAYVWGIIFEYYGIM